jgi:hypothetical protein
MLPYEKQLRGLSQRLRRNMTDMELLMIYKSPLAPLFQRGEENDPLDYAKTHINKEHRAGIFEQPSRNSLLLNNGRLI